MKNALIVHNPTAGDGHTEKDELIRLVEIAGFKVDYVSTDGDGWKNFSLESADVLVVAGGDGTVRKLAKTLLKNHKSHIHVPVAIVPLGTANNIAKTLGIADGVKVNIDLDEYRNYDSGKVSGLGDHSMMLESLGFGAFPMLMHKMQKHPVKDEPAKEKIKRAQGKLIKILKDFKSFKATINADDKKIHGKFLMIELMNIESLGPGLRLAPKADQGDGFFNLVMVKPEDREAMIQYVQSLYDGNDAVETNPKFETIRVKNLNIEINKGKAHVDDELVKKIPSDACKVKMEAGKFKFLDFS